MSQLTEARIEKSDAWRREYHATIGASNAAACLGEGRFKTPDKLWDEMHTVIVEDKLPPSPVINDQMRRGALFESTARELMAEEIGMPVIEHDQECFRYNDRYPWAHCLPDGWVGDVSVELKVPHPYTVAKCNREGLIPEWWIGAQHTMAIVETKRVEFGILDPLSARILHLTVQRDDVFIDEMMQAQRLFFDSIRAGMRPKVEQVIVGEETPVLDGTEPRELAEAFLRLRSIEKDAKDQKDSAKEQILALANHAEVFVVPGVMRATYKRQKAKRVLDLKMLDELYHDAFIDDRVWAEKPGALVFKVYPEKS